MGFFDKLKDGLEQGVSTIGAKSKEMIDTTKVKLEIDSLQKKKRSAFEDIGILVYTMLTDGSIDEAKIKEKCEAVTNIENQIKEKEKELEQIHQ